VQSRALVKNDAGRHFQWMTGAGYHRISALSFTRSGNGTGAQRLVIFNQLLTAGCEDRVGDHCHFPAGSGLQSELGHLILALSRRQNRKCQT
jgi:hypothetical protein